MAFNNNLSIIEGPPGTGKTQTILNIIANAVMRGQSVAVVSNNNAAIKNIYEKLENKGVDFIAALLGNSQNKKEFIESQKEIPDLSKYKLSTSNKERLRKRISALSDQLIKYLSEKNTLAIKKLEEAKIKTEYRYFNETYKWELTHTIQFKKNISANKILSFWAQIEDLYFNRKHLNFFRKIIFRIKYGIKTKELSITPLDELILNCQLKYYPIKIAELSKEIASLEGSLNSFLFDTKMKSYIDDSVFLFKAELFERYSNKRKAVYKIEELHFQSNEFIEDYPIILSTTYSLRKSLSEGIIYDYVIIDESSQVDLATGALALSCAKRAIIVGDTKQLTNVVDDEAKLKTDQIFDSYNLHNAFRYSTHSILTSIIELFPNISKTLLREHYRCHPKIIEFCNEKFYNNQLIILSDYSSNRQPLKVYKTAAGNHARGTLNQRQIDIIKDEIIPNEKLSNIDLGIVTPYRKQSEALKKAFDGTPIKADTVDKFQGRENDVVIISTVDNEISDFTDNPNRLNVAVSRAKEQLILVVNGNETVKDNNISDLIQFIEYNNFSIVHSEINSIFDLLYKGFEAEREKIIQKTGKVSVYDSENLMYGLINVILSYESFTIYDVVLHFSLRNLIKDFSLLTDREMKYAQNPLTHLDFIIFNKLSKKPVLAIEVDGYEFHKNKTRQAERDIMKDGILKKYNIPILRFNTNESNEKTKLINKLNEINQLRQG